MRLLSIDPRIMSEMRTHQRPIWLGLLCSGGSALILVGTAKLIELTVAAVEAGNGQALTLLSLAVVGVFGLRYFFTRGQVYYLSEAATLITSGLRRRLFAKLQRLPVSYFNSQRAGNIQSVLSNDVNVFQGAVTNIRDAIDGPIKIVGGLAAAFVIQWQLALVSIAVVPVMVWFIGRNARKMRTAQADVQNDLADLNSMSAEALQGTRIVKAFGAEPVVQGRFDGLVEQSFRSQMRAARRVATLRPMVELIGAAALAVTFLACGWLVQRGQLEVASLMGFLYTLDVINQGFKNVGSLKQTMAQVSAAADRIYGQVLDAPETVSDDSEAQTLERPVGRIEFENVSFTYPDGTEALRNVSFVIEPGTSLALVGPSGAGKSTIADLVLRFYDPSSGVIRFDGVDVRQLKASWLRQQFGVVPQQTFLFAGSIAENLRLGAPEATDAEVRAAADAAHATPFIDATPNGFETMLGERNVRLSGGEGQRLAIARALVRDPRVLLLDEATSNLDAVSERIVTEALDEAMHRRTTLFIAHRLTTAARADQILVLRRGEVLETGTHEALMARDGVYASMYRAFTSGVLDGAIG